MAPDAPAESSTWKSKWTFAACAASACGHNLDAIHLVQTEFFVKHAVAALV
jgi:hypothetical protein